MVNNNGKQSTTKAESPQLYETPTLLEPHTPQETALWGGNESSEERCATPVPDVDDAFFGENDATSLGESVSPTGFKTNGEPIQPERTATLLPNGSWIDDVDQRYSFSNKGDQNDAEGEKCNDSFFQYLEDKGTEGEYVQRERGRSSIQFSGMPGMVLHVLRDYYSVGPDVARQKACYAPLFEQGDGSLNNKNPPRDSTEEKLNEKKAAEEFQLFKEKDYLKMFVCGEARPLAPEQHEHDGYHVLGDSVLWPSNEPNSNVPDVDSEKEDQDLENELCPIDSPPEAKDEPVFTFKAKPSSQHRSIPGLRRRFSNTHSMRLKTAGELNLRNKLNAKIALRAPVTAQETSFAPVDRRSPCRHSVKSLGPSLGSPSGRSDSCGQFKTKTARLSTSPPAPKSSSESDSDSDGEGHRKRRFLRTDVTKPRRSFCLGRGFASPEVPLESVKPLEPACMTSSPKPPKGFQKELIFDEWGEELDYEASSHDEEGPDDKADDCATLSNGIGLLKVQCQTEQSNELILDHTCVPK